MSANLSEVDGKVEMFSAGKEQPWHGLGQRLENPATSEEAIREAHLDWEVKETSLVGPEADGGLAEGHKGMFRSDTKKIISVVGNRYLPIQNRDAFSFMDSLVGGKEAMYHTAGALGFGEKVWMLAKLPGTVTVKGIKGDEIEKFLLLANSHDGTSTLRALLTPIRVVCQNTLSAALSGAEGGVRIRHTKNAMSKVEEAKRVLGIATRFYDDFEGIAGKLAGYRVTEKFTDSYLKLLFPDNKDEKAATRTLNMREEVKRLSFEGPGADLPGVAGSLWGLYNGVTAWVDHSRSTRGADDLSRTQNRLTSIWFGTGAKLKEKALNLAVDLAT